MRLDVVALVFGLLFSSIATLALWASLLGPVDWSLVKVVAPAGLVVIGVVGLTLSRRNP